MNVHRFPQIGSALTWADRVEQSKACAARGDSWMADFHLARIADEAERLDDREWLNAVEYARECGDYDDCDVLIEQQDAFENRVPHELDRPTGGEVWSDADMARVFGGAR
ncbi:hypothetical protein [Croceicoccus sp. Ery15]|uniref:hypothetical protein n=1 Tax=Croceicoccus sp. Ery15 TaxID=1703338 RepID=UPI001E4009F9|nr:hypothetical protein [Croceicoccus sp. Ery15]